jgi:hypothetical protein
MTVRLEGKNVKYAYHKWPHPENSLLTLSESREE